jgi:hypothetical protein
MKKIGAVIFLFVFCSGSYAQTSIYVPFPDSNAVWFYTEFCQTGICGLNKIILSSEDTTIATFNYTKLYSGIDLIGFLRQDKPAKKVFYWQKDSLKEKLLYDFDLNVGDTLPGSVTGCYPYAQIISIDSTNSFGNSYRKTFEIGGNVISGNSLIEGVGTWYGILANYCGVTGTSFTLNCFSVNDTVLFNNGASWANCELPNGLKTSEAFQYYSGALFPNPANPDEYVELSLGSDHGKGKVLITDIVGSVAREIKIEYNQEKVMLNFATAGVYFVTVLSDDFSYHKSYKLIIGRG